MDPVKRKVISELFFAPSVVLPIVAGVSSAMLSWAAGGVNALSAAAVAGILGGLGWMATRMIFRVEQITEDVMNVQAQKERQAEDAKLDELKRELQADGDPRTQDYLTLLRSLRDNFFTSCQQSGMLQRSSHIRAQVDELFQVCVEQLAGSLQLYRLASQLTGPARHKILADRARMLEEVNHTIENLRSVISEFQVMTQGNKRADLSTLRQELELSLRTAKRTEQRMRELETDTTSESSLREP